MYVIVADMLPDQRLAWNGLSTTDRIYCSLTMMGAGRGRPVIFADHESANNVMGGIFQGMPMHVEAIDQSDLIVFWAKHERERRLRKGSGT